MTDTSTRRGVRMAGVVLTLALLATACDLPRLVGDAANPPAGEDTATDDGTASDPAPDDGGAPPSGDDHAGMDHGTSGMGPAIDDSAIPDGGAARRDVDIRQLVDTTPVEFQNHGFRVVCEFSHMAYDDPIVFPGQPGASHLHTFFGNTTTDASSTIDSLMAGDTTCFGGRAGNRSAYWVPAMVDTRTDAPIAPSSFIVYYKVPFNTGVDRRDVQPVPNDLRIIAGAQDFSATQDLDHLSYSGCGSSDDGALPDCSSAGEMRMSLSFPACWDGENLDSADHRSHMAYPTNEDNGCPDSHPVMLPTITLNVTYEVPVGTNPRQHWRLSSDMYPESQPGGFSGHGDVFLAWADGVVDWWTENCLRASASCTIGGDG